MNIVIIEDENVAAERLFAAIKKIDEDVSLLYQPDSIKSSVDFFKHNKEKVDLIFCDIQLSDGLSFEIFKKVELRIPVIFTTAYDEYAVKAFKLASVDYLLKPIKKDELQAAILKFKAYFDKTESHAKIELLQDALNKFQQKRIVVKYGHIIKAIEISDAAYFYSKQKVTLMTMKNGEVLPIDENLDELERILDPKQFFRINRQCILCFEAIENMYTYSKSRVKVILKPKTEDETIVSTDRSSDFKAWLLGR
jgi:DNA-binding LytR/AlgR family response regulator